MHMEIQQPPVKVTSVLQTCCACHWGLPAAPLLLGDLHPLLPRSAVPARGEKYRHKRIGYTAGQPPKCAPSPLPATLLLCSCPDFATLRNNAPAEPRGRAEPDGAGTLRSIREETQPSDLPRGRSGRCVKIRRN